MWPEGFLLGIPRGHFAYSVLCDVASLRATSRTGIISEALCRKGASESERFRHNAPRLSEVLKIQKLVFGFLKFSEAADNRCSAKLRSEASKFGGQWAPRRVQENCERASNFAELFICELVDYWFIISYNFGINFKSQTLMNESYYPSQDPILKLKQEMKLRKFSQKTIKSYLYYITALLKYANKNPKTFNTKRRL